MTLSGSNQKDVQSSKFMLFYYHDDDCDFYEGFIQYGLEYS